MTTAAVTQRTGPGVGPAYAPAVGRAARLLTALYALATLIALVVWAEAPESHHPGRVVLLLDTLNLPVGHSLVSVVVCALVTRALVGRKRVGWYAVVGFQLLGFYLSAQELLTADQAPAWAPWRWQSDVGRVLDVVSLVLTPVLLWGLWRIRGAFSGRLQRGSWQAAGSVLALSAVLAAVSAWLLLWVSGAGAPAPLAHRWWAVMAISLGDRDGGAARELYELPLWLLEIPSVILSLGLVAGVVLFLRSARHETDWSGDRELAIRRLLARHGEDDSLGYFATRRDKASIFSRDQQAVVTYRVLNGVSLASGDPVGRPESWRDAVAQWMAEAREFGWVPAVLSASEAGARVYAELGLRVLPLGDEAILHPDTFDLRRTSMTPVRRAAQRASRTGVVCTVRRQHAIDAAELEELADLAEQWRGDEPERGFSMALNRTQDAGRRSGPRRHRTRPGGSAAGGALAGAVGPAEGLPRPDAAQPGGPQRARRADGDHPDGAGERARRTHGLAELLHVPPGVRRRRAGRLRRADAVELLGPGHPRPLLAARAALRLQPEVRTGVVPAVLLPRGPGVAAAGGPGRGDGRGFRPAAAADAPHSRAPPHRRRARRGGRPRRRVDGPRGGCSRGVPTRPGTGWSAWPRSRLPAARATRSRRPGPTTPSPPSAPRPGCVVRRSAWRVGCGPCATTGVSCSRP